MWNLSSFPRLDNLGILVFSNGAFKLLLESQVVKTGVLCDGCINCITVLIWILVLIHMWQPNYPPLMHFGLNVLAPCREKESTK